MKMAIVSSAPHVNERLSFRLSDVVLVHSEHTHTISIFFSFSLSVTFCSRYIVELIRIAMNRLSTLCKSNAFLVGDLPFIMMMLMMMMTIRPKATRTNAE